MPDNGCAMLHWAALWLWLWLWVRRPWLRLQLGQAALWTHTAMATGASNRLLSTAGWLQPAGDPHLPTAGPRCGCELVGLQACRLASLQAACYPLPLARCRLPAAACPLPLARCRLIAWGLGDLGLKLQLQACNLQAAGLGLACRLAGLQNCALPAACCRLGTCCPFHLALAVCGFWLRLGLLPVSLQFASLHLTSFLFEGLQARGLEDLLAYELHPAACLMPLAICGLGLQVRLRLELRPVGLRASHSAGLQACKLAHCWRLLTSGCLPTAA